MKGAVVLFYICILLLFCGLIEFVLNYFEFAFYNKVDFLFKIINRVVDYLSIIINYITSYVKHYVKKSNLKLEYYKKYEILKFEYNTVYNIINQEVKKIKKDNRRYLFLVSDEYLIELYKRSQKVDNGTLSFFFVLNCVLLDTSVIVGGLCSDDVIIEVNNLLIEKVFEELKYYYKNVDEYLNSKWTGLMLK